MLVMGEGKRGTESYNASCSKVFHHQAGSTMLILDDQMRTGL